MSLMRLLFGTKPEPKPEPRPLPKPDRLVRIVSDAPLMRSAPQPEMFEFHHIEKELFDKLTEGTMFAGDDTLGMTWLLCPVVVFTSADGSPHYPLVAYVKGYGHFMLGQPVPVDVYKVLVQHKSTYRISE